MTDCGCEKAKAELEEYLHHELSGPEAADVKEHLGNCDDCTQEHLVGITLTRRMQDACKEKAPEELRAAVLSRLTDSLA